MITTYMKILLSFDDIINIGQNNTYFDELFCKADKI